MGKKKHHESDARETMPPEDAAMETVEAPEVMEAEGPVLEEEPETPEESLPENAEGEVKETVSAMETTDIEAQVTQLERETHELKETLLRKMAEFENLKKRTAREKQEAVRYGTAEVLTRLLEVLDNFDRALLLTPDSESFDVHSFYEGTKLISKHLLDILKGEGLMEINPVGEPFDPFFHEAMMREETKDFPDNTVIEVFQKGYKLKDRLLRPARVKVALHPAGPPEESDVPAGEAANSEESES